MGTSPVACCVVLCCAVLCCVVLCCAVLCCAVLCCSVLCCAVLCCVVLCCAVLCCEGDYRLLIGWCETDGQTDRCRRLTEDIVLSLELQKGGFE